MIHILTCKVGETIINCFDKKYDKYTLKQWSDKNKLICPVCGGNYEYCHGEFVIPYFRHKDKTKCEEYYSEPETKEHMIGKQLIYEWLQRQNNIENLKLEAWIPETKQRPDLYFTVGDQKYVIEFQCTPIASEYVQRHELYKLANIHDIWIMGTEKYNFTSQDYKSNKIEHNLYYKVLEKYSSYYLDVYSKKLILLSKPFKETLKLSYVLKNEYIHFNLNDFFFNIDNNELQIKSKLAKYLNNKDTKIANKANRKKKIKNYLFREKELIRVNDKADNEKIHKIMNLIVSKLSKLINYSILGTISDGRYYSYKIELHLNYEKYIFFITKNSLSFCKYVGGLYPNRVIKKFNFTKFRSSFIYSYIRNLIFDEVEKINIKKKIELEKERRKFIKAIGKDLEGKLIYNLKNIDFKS